MRSAFAEVGKASARSMMMIEIEGFGFSYFRKRLFFGLDCAFVCVISALWFPNHRSSASPVGEPSLPVVGLGEREIARTSERNERSAGAGMAAGGA